MAPVTIHYHISKHGNKKPQEPVVRKQEPQPTRTIVIENPKPTLIILDHAPLSTDIHPQGTQALDMKTRDLYVQVSSDTQKSHWVVIEREKKGLLGTLSGWFKKT